MKEERGFLMKKLLALLLAAAMLCLAGCDSLPKLPARYPWEDSKPSESVQPSSDDASELPDYDYDDSLLSETTYEEMPWSDSYGNSGVCSVHLPAIDSDAPGAQMINALIESDFTPKIDEILSEVEAGTAPVCQRIGWESHWSGSIVTLLLISETDYGFIDYATYSYDFATDEVLSGTEVVQRVFGMAYSSLLPELRRSVAQYFDRQYAGVFDAAYCDFIEMNRASTITDDNLASAMFFTDGMDLCAILPVYSPAGAAWYYEVVPVVFQEMSAQPLYAAYDFVEATLEDNSLLVTFSDTGSARDWNVDFDFGTPYWVENCYGVYTQLEIAEMSFGLDSSIYLLLLTQDGTVEFVNLLHGVRYGMMSCCGPALPLGGITALTADQGTVYAVGSDGVTYDLNEVIPGLLEDYLPDLLTGTWTAKVQLNPNSSEETDCMMELHGDAFLYLEETDPYGNLTRIDGNLRFFGMDGGGMLFAFFLTGDGAQHSGIMRLLRDDFGNLLVRPLLGEDLFAAGANGCTTFQWG